MFQCLDSLRGLISSLPPLFFMNKSVRLGGGLASIAVATALVIAEMSDVVAVVHVTRSWVAWGPVPVRRYSSKFSA